MAGTREGMKEKEKTDPEATKTRSASDFRRSAHLPDGRAWKSSFIFLVPTATISAALGRTPIWRFGADGLYESGSPIFGLFPVFRIEPLCLGSQQLNKLQRRGSDKQMKRLSARSFHTLFVKGGIPRTRQRHTSLTS